MNVEKLIEKVGMEATVIGDGKVVISKFSDIKDAQTGSIVFCKARGNKARDMIEESRASVIACHKYTLPVDGKTLILTDSPRLFFIRALEIWTPRIRGIHPSVEIADCVRIGKNVVIHPGCVLGEEGFGFERNERGAYEIFPHIGNLIIEDDVSIGSGCVIDRGTLRDTIIKRGAKIGNLVHIGHNVEIGEDVIIGSKASVHGGAKIGNGAYIGPGARIRDGIEVGEEALVGMGSVVTKDVPKNLVVIGVPAKADPRLKKPDWMPIPVPCSVCRGEDPHCLICYGTGRYYRWVPGQGGSIGEYS